MVWVKKLVLYESIDPIDEIRQISSRPGLNIIQGEADESDEAFQSGHGIGKTTVCRLIRYCLGEKSFGQKHVVEEVKHCFPDAYVGAVIELDGCGVGRAAAPRKSDQGIRPGGRDPRRPCESEGREALRRLHREADCAGPVRTFRSSESLTERPNPPVAPRPGHVQQGPGEPIRPLLELASYEERVRARRSSTSRRSMPGCASGRSSACSTRRSPGRERSWRSLRHPWRRTRTRSRMKRAEPGFHITRLRSSLVGGLRSAGRQRRPAGRGQPARPPSRSESRLEALRHEVARGRGTDRTVDRQISLAAASLLEPAELAEQLRAASEVTGDGNDALLADIERLRSIRQFIRDAESALCRYGDVMIGQCSYVQARARQIDDEMRDRQRSTLPTVSEREQVAARLAEQAERRVHRRGRSSSGSTHRIARRTSSWSSVGT